MEEHQFEILKKFVKTIGDVCKIYAMTDNQSIIKEYEYYIDKTHGIRQKQYLQEKIDKLRG